MPFIKLDGTEIEVDEDGFIQEPDKWSEELAMVIAQTEDVDDLTEDHWKVINYLRNYYQQFGIAPMIRAISPLFNTLRAGRLVNWWIGRLGGW
ncbi:MAG: TusE/DsrC/DsvC family sulfur relay protein [Anaerolineae bacterium]